MIVAFLGPSLPAGEARGFRVLPPARQGDIWRALKLRPRAIALIDGVFESQPSVWHHEILDALAAGVAVVGGASMGALRAAELQGKGMIGVGQIYRWYRDGTLDDDSEVALLHADKSHAYRALTVPQVNVRWSALRSLPPRAAQDLIDASARIFYQERTWPRVLALLPRSLRGRFRQLDLKAADARAVLRAASGARRPRAAPANPSSLVRRRKLHQLHQAKLRKLWLRRDARDLVDAGLRRALLAGWARELGLRPDAAELEWARRRGIPAPLREEVILERRVLEHAERMLNDGPSVEEALAAEAQLRGIWPK